MQNDQINWQARLGALASPRFEELYPAQEAALNSYSEGFLEESNVAIELPTGAGKTLIALMILDLWRERRKKAAVLCGTKNLARQFKEEADALGIPTILFEGSKSGFSTADKFKYTQAKAIAIMNYWGYINQNPGLEPADVVVMDDAHLAENAAHGLFSLDISRFEHEELYLAVVAHLAIRFPHYTALTEYATIGERSLSINELISFTDWIDAAADIAQILSSSDECNEGDLSYAWRRIKLSIQGSLCLIGPNSITIRPGCYPLINEKHIRQPKQRIMLSATIGSADDLSRRIGIPGIKKLPIESRYRLSVPGKRLMVFPDREEREAELEVLTFETASKLTRSVWLCSSAAEAKVWSEKLATYLVGKGIADQPILIAEARAEEIDQFVDAKKGHLFTAGRYEGMDFEGDICRLVVMPSLPTACGTFEKFISENLADASFMFARVLQRIKQAFGRATRNDHDYAVYFFLKSSFSSYLTTSEVYEKLPANVQNEIGFGVDVSEKPIEEISKVIASFLRGKLGEIKFPQQTPDYPEEELEEESSLADAEVDFWKKLMITRSYDEACADAEKVASVLYKTDQPGYSLFWRYLKAHAAYLRYQVDGDPHGLGNAKSEIGKILDEPRQSFWFSRLNRLRNTLNLEQVPDDDLAEEFDRIAAGWNTLLDGDLRNQKKHVAFFNTLMAGISGNDHGEFCHAVRNLMRLVGWQAEIRDKVKGETDVIATVTVSLRQYLLIFEGKPDMEADKPVPLRYVTQATGQIDRYAADPHFTSYKVGALFVSKSTKVDEAARLPATRLTFIHQTALASCAHMAIAAFQRYSTVRMRKGLLPKRSECVESLQLSPKLLGLFEISQQPGQAFLEPDVMRAMKR